MSKDVRDAIKREYARFTARRSANTPRGQSRRKQMSGVSTTSMVALTSTCVIASRRSPSPYTAQFRTKMKSTTDEPGEFNMSPRTFYPPHHSTFFDSPMLPTSPILRNHDGSVAVAIHPPTPREPTDA